MSLVIQLNTLASDLRRIETELVTALTHTNHGNISPLILTPKQLRSEIAKIKGHLPMGRALPVEDTDLLELYKIMSIQGTVAYERVIFIIELPLVNQEQFELFKKQLSDLKAAKGNKISSTSSIYWIRGTIFIWTDHSDSNRLANSTLQQKKSFNQPRSTSIRINFTINPTTGATQPRF
ncbi:hypothetical protein EVAR_71379_1 [Eumeta japonica]|uniref:Uncharacterized protein n=1 Tax=Eumeta variegata TaxID=151549 RepID=A0A4C1S7W7_EUMVA|nr:hypothetical protein EVAR_71379_1 [Eumeta japonica]